MGAPHTTPGPWMAAAGPSSVVGWPIVSCGREQSGRSIGNVSWMPGLPDDVNRTIRANGLQMAASPDLYDALEQAAGKFREYEQMHLRKLDGAELGGPSVAIEEKVTRNREMAELCELALAKARGEPLEQDR